MAKFEVHIPAAEDGGFNVTLKVDADNWMGALKAGLTRLGEQNSSVQNVMVDMQEDNSIHITEPRSNRVFRIRELSEEEAARAPVKRPSSQIRRPPSRPPMPAPPAAEPQPKLDVHAAKTFIGAPPLDFKKPPFPDEAKTPPHGTAAPDLSLDKTPVPGTLAPPPAGKLKDDTLNETKPPPAGSRPDDTLAETKPPPADSRADDAFAETKPPTARPAEDPQKWEKTLEKPPEVVPAKAPAKTPERPPPAPARPAPAAASAPAVGPAPRKRPTSQIRVPKGAAKSSPRFVEELEHPTLPVNKPIGRARPKSFVGAAPPPPQPDVEDMLADVFERVLEINGMKTVDDALYFVLDLALEKVPADAGSVFKADAASGDLTFAAARGPKAKELVASKLVVPAGEGIAGFCAAEGVSVAISDVQKDPRYYAAVSARVDYETRSVVCSPMMTHGRSFGCIQLINRKGGPHFAEHEVGLVSYLAHQAALYLNNQG